LVVDDNVDAAHCLALLLQLNRCEVRTAHDGANALKVADSFQPDVILLDIGLPGMDGYEVARRLREQPAFAKTILVAITGYGREEDVARSREAGFDCHLVKPVDPARLQSLMLEHNTAR
jgi:CheY-like chemotaxis protein